MRPLQKIRVLEMAGLAPAPYAGMILADFGADVVRIDRAGLGGPDFDPTRDYLARGKRSLGLNMKDPRGVETLLRLIENSDVLIDPYRPGVMEKLGVAPEVALARNSALVYARLTGFGQQGPYSTMAGHDINYIAMSGALSLLGREGEKPTHPVNLLGDFAGGGMLCALGIMMALFERSNSGRGQVIDSAMVDGAAHLSTFLFGFDAAGIWSERRGSNLLDTAAPFYDTYETSDGAYMAVGAIEPQFYTALLHGLGLGDEDLPHQMDRAAWPGLKKRFSEIFRNKTRAQWTETFDGSDACVCPVLSLGEAPENPHNVERRTFYRGVQGHSAPAAAPRLSRTPGHASDRAPSPGQHTNEILASIGIDDDEIEHLRKQGIAG